MYHRPLPGTLLSLSVSLPDGDRATCPVGDTELRGPGREFQGGLQPQYSTTAISQGLRQELETADDAVAQLCVVSSEFM